MTCRGAGRCREREGTTEPPPCPPHCSLALEGTWTSLRSECNEERSLRIGPESATLPPILTWAAEPIGQWPCWGGGWGEA